MDTDIIPVVLESKPEDAHHFVTKLAQPLILEGEWEVALQELIIPQTWNNVTKDNNQFGIQYRNKKGEIKSEMITIPEGYYETVNDILTAMSAQIPAEVRSDVDFAYNAHTRLVTITLGAIVRLHFDTVTINSELGSMLGFDVDFLAEGTTTEASYPCILDSIQCLYIYSDCIKPVAVGDSIAPLIHVVPVTVPRPRSIYASYSQPRFIPASKQAFDRIAISIRSNTGKHITFIGGNSYLKLIFKKVGQ